MANYSNVQLIGRIVKDHELKQAGETAVSNFSVAVSRKVKDNEFTSFIDCKAFGKSAELLSKYTHKGSSIFITGELRQEKWETEGQNRSKIVVIVEDFQFLDSAPNKDTQEKTVVASKPTGATGKNAKVTTKAKVETQEDVPF